jgi:hypothetical protein
MRPMLARLFALAAAAVVTLTVRAEEPAAPVETATAQRYTLRYQYSANQVLRYALTNESTINAQAGNFAETVEQKCTTTRKYRVLSVDPPGNASIEVTFERVQLTATAGQDLIEYDSDSAAPVPTALQGIKGTIGTPRGTIRLAPTGTVLDIELATDDTQFKESRTEFMPPLPEQPVAVGETWKEEFSVDVAIETPPFKKPIRLQRLYSLRSVENGVATIDERTIVLTPGLDAKLEGQLMRRTAAGTCTLDLDRGLLIQREVSIDNRVVGFEGPNTMLHVKERREDRLLPEDQVAGQPVNDAATK